MYMFQKSTKLLLGFYSQLLKRVPFGLYSLKLYSELKLGNNKTSPLTLHETADVRKTKEMSVKMLCLNESELMRQNTKEPALLC